MDVHRVGGGEKPHRERSSLFGTLVVCLPLEHTGGDLIVRHKGVVVVFDWANRIEQDLLLQKQMQKQQAISGSIDDLCPPAIHWAAFNSACEHEILPVQSGLRVTVTYNLLLVDTGTSDVICPPVDAISLGPFHALLAALLKDPVFMPRGGTLGFGLQHQYPMGLNIPETVFLLKGVDLLVYKGATALGIRVRMMAAYAPQHDSGSDFDRRDNYDVLMDQKSGKKYRSLDVFKQYRRSFGHTSYGVYVGEKFSERWWDEEYDGAILTEGLGAVHDRSIKWVHYPTSDYGKTYLAYVSGGSELEYDVSVVNSFAIFKECCS
ncbi:hypothetical protein BDR26DRAFT_868383 [Obelidium mucronatum]|nr:hypothetical protein BDR26DRAFT_868383 [Obelidium mucronatum]